MPRPTNDKKGKVIKVRVSDEMYEKIENLGSISTVVREMIEDALSNVPQNPKRKIESESFVPQKRYELTDIMSEDTYRDLEQMCRLSGFTLTRFMDYIRRLFDRGNIYVDGMTIKTKGEYDLGHLEEVCHRNNLDVQDVIDKIVNRLIKG